MPCGVMINAPSGISKLSTSCPSLVKVRDTSEIPTCTVLVSSGLVICSRAKLPVNVWPSISSSISLPSTRMNGFRLYTGSPVVPVVVVHSVSSTILPEASVTYPLNTCSSPESYTPAVPPAPSIQRSPSASFTKILVSAPATPSTTSQVPSSTSFKRVSFESYLPSLFSSMNSFSRVLLIRIPNWPRNSTPSIPFTPTLAMRRPATPAGEITRVPLPSETVTNSVVPSPSPNPTSSITMVTSD